ncbi:unnamed protein product [Rotaria sp. Silwood1]|nr:unnamed protein product [Rotaria sp. Silwood1]CAF1348020.1 unnamed protein product [Rotaria sp. Silwood1]CAF3531553.1 unnamed protein product [Rotaria sp. Silwood1]CAF3590047.1 unnamed protein product [Rotaria sp. Silwood1]CAF4780100.1 unnamed protein product [Rotaria sp. Silwood1]
MMIENNVLKNEIPPVDKWNSVVVSISEHKESQWKDLNHVERIKHVLLVIGKVIGLLFLLYIFVCSLDIMSSAFRLVGGKITGKAFTEGAILSNPIAGLMLGLLATVIVQSSSTSTSIVVSMVSSSILPVRRAIPIIMGANIGTSVTNTIVALTQSNRRDEFRRAFAGATVHDMFNWVTVIVLLPLELASGLLFHLTEAITRTISLDRKAGSNPQFLNVLTKPLTHRIIQLDEKVIQNIALGSVESDISLIKRYCSYENVTNENATSILLPENHCGFIFSKISWPDWSVGLLLLVLSLVSLCACLILLVKLLQSMLKGTISTVIHKTVNADFPGVFHHLTPYLAIGVGCIFTILVQSSSIFTSTLTPLVGLGIITIERMYPFTLGSNIGTTITGIMAALTATTAQELRNSLQIALCHTFFNIFGILIWFPIPIMRNVPIALAKKLGETTANYRWFAIVYIIGSFFLIPLIIFCISLAGWYVFVGVFGPILFIAILVIIINFLQVHKPNILPHRLQTWSWLPRPFRTLAWYDEHVFRSKKNLISSIENEPKELTTITNQNIEHNYGHMNKAFNEQDDVDKLSQTGTHL